MTFVYSLCAFGLGTLFGVTVMAVMQVASDADDWMEQHNKKHK